MSGSLVWQWPATAVSYLVYLRDVFPFRVLFSLKKRKKAQGAKPGE
jgi:hypothetical protein